MYYTNSQEINFGDSSLYKIHGRTRTDDNGLLLSWSNSGVEVNFRGERLEVFFNDYICDASVWVAAFIDDRIQRFGLCGKEPKILIDFDKDSTHRVKLLRISEGDVFLPFLKFKIYGKSPEVLPPDEDKSLKLEFLGDSITTGWGVRAPGNQDTFNTYEQDSTKSYAFMTSLLLDAEIRSEAMGGQGVFRNCGKEPGVQFKDMFDMTLPHEKGYDHSSWTPDVMVLNCGTNDEPGGTTEEAMYAEASFLIDKVRATYPSAKIIWMYGMMNCKFTQTLKNVVADKQNAGDKNVYFLPIEKITREKNEVGAVWHPNVNASVRVSKELSNFIQKILQE